MRHSGKVSAKMETGQRGYEGEEEKRRRRRIERQLVWLEWSESEVTKGEAWRFP